MAFKQMLAMLVVLVIGMTTHATATPSAKSICSQLDLQVASIATESEPHNSFHQEVSIDHFNQLHYFQEGDLIELVITEEDDNEESTNKLKKGTEGVKCNPFAISNGICFANQRNESVSAECTYVHAFQQKRFVLISVFRI